MKKYIILLLYLVQLHGFSQSKPLKQVIEIVYQFDNDGDNIGAKNALLNFKKNKLLSTAELNYINNYILYYDYYIEGELDLKKIDLALQSSLKIQSRKPFETELLLNLYTAKYHHLAYKSGWDAALEVAVDGLEIPDFEQAISKTKTNFLYDCGYLYDKVGNSYEGIRFYKKSLEKYIKEFGEINTDVALNYNNLAYAYSNVYNEKRTIEYYNKAARIWEKIHKTNFDKDDYLVTVYQNLTFKYLSYGDIENAKLNCQKLNNYFENKYKSFESQKNAKYLTSKNSYVFTNVRLQIALKNIKTAVKLVETLTSNQLFEYKNKDNLRYLMGCNEAIMDFYIDNNKYHEAIDLGKKMIAIAQKHNYSDFDATTYSKISNAYKNLNDNQQALQFIEKAIEANNLKTIFNSSKYTLSLLKANLYKKNNQYRQAKAQVKNVLEELILLHKKIKKPIEKINFNDVNDLISTDFINIFIESGKIYYDQNSKSKKDIDIAHNLYKISSSLFKEYYLKGEYNETLSSYQSEINDGLLNIAIQKKMSQVDKINLINSIEQNASEHLIKAYRRKIKHNSSNNEFLTTLNELKAELYFYKNQKNNNPKLKKFNTQKQIELVQQIDALSSKISLSEKQLRQVSAGNFDVKLVLNEIESECVILKYYVTQNTVFGVALSKNEIKINKLGSKVSIENWVKTNLISNRTIQNDYKKQVSGLYKNLIPKINGKKIIVIPDNFLNYLPFESLYNEKNKRFLVQDFDVSYEYSLPMWLLHKKFTISKTPNNFVAFAPNYPNVGIGTTRSDLKDLIFAKKEAIAIAKLYNGKLFLNKNATKNAFLAHKENFGIYHFSMHSLLFEDDFNKSSLVFSNNEKLYFSEMYALNFPAQMVVLSACDTGNGVLKSGEGVMSISRALTYAGVNATVMSLWQVPDKETAEIMITFYENLKNGQTKDEALANAKRSFITKNPMKNHPFYWAGFVINGNVTSLQSNNFWEFILASGIILLIVGVAFRKHLLKLF